MTPTLRTFSNPEVVHTPGELETQWILDHCRKGFDEPAEKALAEWVVKQRGLVNEGKLDPERVQQMQEVLGAGRKGRAREHSIGVRNAL